MIMNGIFPTFEHPEGQSQDCKSPICKNRFVREDPRQQYCSQSQLGRRQEKPDEPQKKCSKRDQLSYSIPKYEEFTVADYFLALSRDLGPALLHRRGRVSDLRGDLGRGRQSHRVQGGMSDLAILHYFTFSLLGLISRTA